MRVSSALDHVVFFELFWHLRDLHLWSVRVMLARIYIYAYIIVAICIYVLQYVTVVMGYIIYWDNAFIIK